MHQLLHWSTICAGALVDNVEIHKVLRTSGESSPHARGLGLPPAPGRAARTPGWWTAAMALAALNYFVVPCVFRSTISRDDLPLQPAAAARPLQPASVQLPAAPARRHSCHRGRVTAAPVWHLRLRLLRFRTHPCCPVPASSAGYLEEAQVELKRDRFRVGKN